MLVSNEAKQPEVAGVHAHVCSLMQAARFKLRYWSIPRYDTLAADHFPTPKFSLSNPEQLGSESLRESLTAHSFHMERYSSKVDVLASTPTPPAHCWWTSCICQLI